MICFVRVTSLLIFWRMSSAVPVGDARDAALEICFTVWIVLDFFHWLCHNAGMKDGKMTFEEWHQNERERIERFGRWWREMTRECPECFSDVMLSGDWDEQYMIWDEEAT